MGGDSRRGMLYCYKMTVCSAPSGILRFRLVRMTHHHHPGHGHPAAVAMPSLLRMPLAQRLMVAAIVVAAIWALVWWAIG